MIKRTIDISEGPTRLSIELDQLVLTRDRQEIARIPCEDVGVLLVDHHSTTYTHAVFTRLAEAGACAVLCGANHLPAALVLPMQNNELTARRTRTQAACLRPLRKRLWRQIVRRKVRGQAENLPEDHPVRKRLIEMAKEVKSGDVTNIEGQAARFYWPALMGSEFRRDPDGLPPNGLLNYGYMVMRTAVARALVAAGLHPSFGLQHQHRNNTFALADDLVEVLRPRIDRWSWNWRATKAAFSIGPPNKNCSDCWPRRCASAIRTVRSWCSCTASPHRWCTAMKGSRTASTCRYIPHRPRRRRRPNCLIPNNPRRTGFCSPPAASSIHNIAVRLSAYRLMWLFVLFDLPVDMRGAKSVRAISQVPSQGWVSSDTILRLRPGLPERGSRAGPHPACGSPRSR